MKAKLPFGVIFDLVDITKMAIWPPAQKQMHGLSLNLHQNPPNQGQATLWSHF